MKIYGTHDVETIAQLQRCVDAVPGAKGVLCADGHRGYSMPIGGVVAYDGFVSPSGVGYDIACGNMAVETTILAKDFTAEDRIRVADQIQKDISFGLGRANDDPVDHPMLASIFASPVPEQRKLIQSAHAQLGTVGSGNHYVDVLVDDGPGGHVWVAVHFGSRGFGYKTASMFMNVAQGKPIGDCGHEGEMDAPPLLLDVNTPSGQDYIAAMTIAGDYAYAGRETVVLKVLDILGATALHVVHNHHNFAWKETHFGQNVWVIRKGATPAFPGQRGFIGGSMGDICAVVHGLSSNEADASLNSAPHGAGRLMSRKKAAGKSRQISRWKCQNYRKCDYTAPKGDYVKDAEDGTSPHCPKCGNNLRLTRMLEQIAPGVVDWPVVQAGLAERGLILRGGGADEAPQVYRPLLGVLSEHYATVKIDYVLRPVIVVMADKESYDPFKD